MDNFTVGDRCLVHRLESEAGQPLNGQHVTLADAIIEKGRFKCKLDDGSFANIKPCNLQIINGDPLNQTTDTTSEHPIFDCYKNPNFYEMVKHIQNDPSSMAHCQGIIRDPRQKNDMSIMVGMQAAMFALPNLRLSIAMRRDVVIRELINSKHLNGCEGELLSWVPSKERYNVHLYPNHTIVAIRPKNIFHNACPRVRLPNGSEGRIHAFQQGGIIPCTQQWKNSPFEPVDPNLKVSVLLDDTGERVMIQMSELTIISEQAPGTARLQNHDHMWDQAYLWSTNKAGVDCEEALIELSPKEVYKKIKEEILEHQTYEGVKLSMCSWRFYPADTDHGGEKFKLSFDFPELPKYQKTRTKKSTQLYYLGNLKEEQMSWSYSCFDGNQSPLPSITWTFSHQFTEERMWNWFQEFRAIIQEKGKESSQGREVLNRASNNIRNEEQHKQHPNGLNTKTRNKLKEMSLQHKHSCGLDSCNMTTGEGGQRLLQCSRCRSVFYCTPEHQQADWKKHKKVCRRSHKKKKTVDQ